jgi:membrane-bound lytic murein transglycosylase D
MTTPRDTSFDLHIPVGTHDVFTERLKEIPEDKRSSWRFHVVRPGETLDGIATTLHAHASDIVAANGVALNDGVDTGDELVIPVTTAAAGARPQRYAMRRGDTLVTVADRFGVSVEDLRRWNHLSSKAVHPGTSLAVVEPVKLAPGTHVHGRGTRRRSSVHTASTSVHQGSAHSASAHKNSKSATSSASSKSTSKNSSSEAELSSATKMKKKATR